MSKIGILTLSRIKSSQRSTYNLQDMGLARALAGKGHEIILYRLTEDESSTQDIEGIRVTFLKAAGVGKQSLTSFAFLEKDLERLICFSDNQVSFPFLYRRCRRLGILLLPYIGVLRSNSDSRLVSAVTNALLWRNVRCYRRLKVFVKTPGMMAEMEQRRIRDTRLMPVCLDQDQLNRKFESEDRMALRTEWGYSGIDRILLFIGRMEPEKEPLMMLKLLEQLGPLKPGCREGYQLIMVGKGRLADQVKDKAQERGLSGSIRFVEQIDNRRIWQLYRICDCYVNLNRHEIYGMSILEALYYNCPVVAVRAPGPEYIMREILPEGLCGMEELAERIRETVRVPAGSRKRTKEYMECHFMWENVADDFLG